jgi:hypothetical protein
MSQSVQVECEPLPNDYTTEQARMLSLHDLRRNSLLSAKYYGSKLTSLKRWSTTIDITTALAASGSLTSATAFKAFWDGNLLTLLLTSATILTVIKPILKLGNGIDHCSKLRYGYLELYQKVELLADDVRDATRFDGRHWDSLKALKDNFNKLGLQRDPRESQAKLSRMQDEVERSFPTDRLWLPESNEQAQSTTPETTDGR